MLQNIQRYSKELKLFAKLFFFCFKKLKIPDFTGTELMSELSKNQEFCQITFSPVVFMRHKEDVGSPVGAS